MIAAVLAALTVALAVLGRLAEHGPVALLLIGGSVILLVLQVGIFAGQLARWITT